MDKTANGEYYAQMNLSKAIGRKQLDLLRQGYILHQDNASVHKAKTASYPPYSLHVYQAPCDFWLFQ